MDPKQSNWDARRQSVAIGLLFGLQIVPCFGAISVTCRQFERQQRDVPLIVSDYFSRSSDVSVKECAVLGQSGNPHWEKSHYYAAEGAVKLDGVCTYRSYELEESREGTNPSRLTRKASSAVLMMSASTNACTVSSPDSYTPTYDLSPAEYRGIMEMWRTATASRRAVDDTFAKFDSGSGHDLINELGEAVASGRVSDWTVTRVARMRSLVVLREYVLYVRNPARSSGEMAISVSRWIGGGYRASGISEAVD